MEPITIKQNLNSDLIVSQETAKSGMEYILIEENIVNPDERTGPFADYIYIEKDKLPDLIEALKSFLTTTK